MEHRPEQVGYIPEQEERIHEPGAVHIRMSDQGEVDGKLEGPGQQLGWPRDQGLLLVLQRVFWVEQMPDHPV